jgi:hypothetical protein
VVFSALRPSAHPSRVDHWMTHPSVDLVADGQQVSPEEWLALERTTEPVRTLAVDV